MGWTAAGLAAAALIVAALVLALRPVVVMPWQVALIYRRGRFVREVGPGVHWTAGLGQVKIVHQTAVAQASGVGPVDLFSQEGFACRATLTLTWRIADARTFWEASAGAAAFGGVRLPGFDEAVQAALLQAATERPLASLVKEPQGLAAAVLVALAGRFPAVEIETATITRLTLPPEVRRLTTEVETVRLQGLAALERARGEQAALRSLANAARLVRDNPELAQLRLLQTIESARKPVTVVLGTAPIGAALPTT